MFSLLWNNSAFLQWFSYSLKNWQNSGKILSSLVAAERLPSTARFGPKFSRGERIKAYPEFFRRSLYRRP